MTVTTSVRDQLADVQARKRDLRDRLTRAKAEVAATRDAFAHSGGSDGEDNPEFRAASRAVEARNQVEREIVLADDEERYLLGHAAGLNGTTSVDSFTHNPEVLASLAQMATSSAPVGAWRWGRTPTASRWLA